MLVRQRVASTSTAPITDGISVTCVEDLARVTTGVDVEGTDGSALVFGFGQGGVSRVRFRTKPSAMWIATCNLSLVTPGDLLPCKFGPLFYDEAGNTIKWWHSPPVAFDSNNYMHLRIPATAPEGSAWVRLGMIGPWTQDGKSSAVYRYANCLLVNSMSVSSQQVLS